MHGLRDDAGRGVFSTQLLHDSCSCCAWRGVFSTEMLSLWCGNAHQACAMANQLPDDWDGARILADPFFREFLASWTGTPCELASRWTYDSGIGPWCWHRGFSYATWNYCALFGALTGNAEAQRQRRHCVCDMLTAYDVIALQETHGTYFDMCNLQHDFPSHILVGTFCDTAAAGGCILAIHPRLHQNCYYTQLILEAGRCHMICIATSPIPLLIINLHLDPAHSELHKKHVLNQSANIFLIFGTGCVW